MFQDKNKRAQAQNESIVGGSGGSGYSENPVNFFNGQLDMSLTDLSSPTGFGHSRVFLNGLPSTYEGPQGNNWLIGGMPLLVKNPVSGSDGYIYVDGSNEFYFDPASSGSSTFYVKDTVEKVMVLTKDGNGCFTLVNKSSGLTYKFHKFNTTATDKDGWLDEITNEDGLTITAVYDGNDKLDTLIEERLIGVVTTAYRLDYAFSGDQISGVVLSRTNNYSGSPTWIDLSKVDYTYYGTSESNGSEHDLKHVEIYRYDSTGATWNKISNHHYRYDSNSNLEYVVGPRTFARLTAPLTEDLTASGSGYDHYFEYDNSNRVTKEIANNCVSCSGMGTGSTGDTFERWKRTGSFTDGPNAWSRRILYTRADGTKSDIYTNHRGQEILRMGKDSNDAVLSYGYTEYGTATEDKYKVTLTASHETVSDGTVTLPNGTWATVSGDIGTGSGDLTVTLSATEGRVRYMTFCSSTDAAYENQGSAGEAQGKIKQVHICGGNKPLIDRTLKESYTYYKANNKTGTAQTNPNIISCGVNTGGNTQTNSYGDGSSRTKIKKYPSFLGINSSGGLAVLYPKDTTIFDDYGRVEKFTDRHGTVTEFEYDNTTGNVTKETVNSSAVTDYEYDDFGREIKMLGPVHDAVVVASNGTQTEKSIRHITWTTYHEGSSEDRVLS